MNDLCYLSALELRDHFVRRTLSPVEVTAVLLDRIADVNPALNAFAWDLGGYDDVHAAARYRRELMRRLGPRIIDEARG